MVLCAAFMFKNKTRPSGQRQVLIFMLWNFIVSQAKLDGLFYPNEKIFLNASCKFKCLRGLQRTSGTKKQIMSLTFSLCFADQFCGWRENVQGNEKDTCF